MPPLNVLVTGMSGLIGRAVRQTLGHTYRLSALNRSRVEGVPCHQADIADLPAIEPAFRGVDVVVHLAAIATSRAPWEQILRANIVGTHNVFEAARRAGVRRIVYASSGAVVSAIEGEAPYAALVTGRASEVGPWRRLTHLDPVRPAGLYGVSKVFGEALGRHYADAHGLSVICLRIGAVHAEDRPKSPRDLSVWCSQRDVVQAIDRAIRAPESLRWAVVFITSDNRWGYRDLEHARQTLGYAPLDGVRS
jgi:nucleoside-diphosphate-sugar epimerase